MSFGLISLASCSANSTSSTEAVGTNESAYHATNTAGGNAAIYVVDTGASFPTYLLAENLNTTTPHGYILSCGGASVDLGGIFSLITGAGFDKDVVSAQPHLNLSSDPVVAAAGLPPGSTAALTNFDTLYCSNNAQAPLFYIDLPTGPGGAIERRYFLGLLTTDSMGNPVLEQNAQGKYILRNVGCGELLQAMGYALSDAKFLDASQTSGPAQVYAIDDQYDISCETGTSPPNFVPSVSVKPANQIVHAGASFLDVDIIPANMPSDTAVAVTSDTCHFSPFAVNSIVLNQKNAFVAQGGVPSTFTAPTCSITFAATARGVATQTATANFALYVAPPPPAHGPDEILLAGGRGWSGVWTANSNFAGSNPVQSFLIGNPSVGAGFGALAAQYGMQKLFGDFNGDGRTDLALVGQPGSTTIPVAYAKDGGTWDVYENSNSDINNFANEAATAGARHLVGDFDGDGKSDIVLTGSAATDYMPTAFSLGGGNWTIKSGLPIHDFASASSTAHARLVGDFNRDGKSDVVLLPQASWSQPTNIPVALSKGDGTWTVQTNAAAVFAPSVGVAGNETFVGDFNHDGVSDLVALGANGLTSIAMVFGDGNGGWMAPAITQSDASAQKFLNLAAGLGVRRLVGDFNGDHNADIALVGAAGSTTIPVALSNGDGSWNFVFSGASTFASESASPGATALVGDFNRDGKSDIALTGNASWTTIPVAISNSDGTFTTSDWPVTDADFAKWSHVANVANAAKAIGYAANAQHLYTGDPEPPPSRVKPGNDEVILIGQFPQLKGSLDYMPVAVARGDGSWSLTNGFTEVSNKPPATRRVEFPLGTDFGCLIHYGSETTLLGDYNGDGKTDVAVNAWGFNSIPVAFGTGGDWEVRNPLNPDNGFKDTSANAWASAAGHAFYKAAGDYDGDGKSDVTFSGGDFNTSGPSPAPIAFSNGDGTWRAPTGVNLSAEFSYGVAASHVNGDFNGDGKSDVLVVGPMHPNSPWTSIPVAFSNGDGTWTETNYLDLDGTCKDFNTWASHAGTQYTWAVPLTGDFNGDGRTDVALTGPNDWGTVPIALSLGDGHFTCVNSFASPGTSTISNFASWSSDPSVKRIVGDFDGDGLSDIALTGGRYPSGGQMVPWGSVPVAFANGDGTWSVYNMGSPASYNTGATATWSGEVYSGDFNFDGRTDIALGNYSPGVSTNMPVILLTGRNGYWYSPSANGDVNGTTFLNVLRAQGNPYSGRSQ